MSSEAFDFEQGDRVLVRVRENGMSGNIVVKFTAECEEIETFPTGRTQAKFDLPGMMNRVAYTPHEAEFEVLDEDADQDDKQGVTPGGITDD